MFAICRKYFTVQVSFHFASESPIIILVDIAPQVTATLFIIFVSLLFLLHNFINHSSHSSTISSIISSNFSFKLLNFSVKLQHLLNCFRFPDVFSFYLLVIVVVVVQTLSHVQLFVTLWTTAHQPSLSLTTSWSLTKFTSIIYSLLQ